MISEACLDTNSAAKKSDETSLKKVAGVRNKHDTEHADSLSRQDSFRLQP